MATNRKPERMSRADRVVTTPAGGDCGEHLAAKFLAPSQAPYTGAVDAFMQSNPHVETKSSHHVLAKFQTLLVI